MNCSATRSPVLPRRDGELGDLGGDALLLVERERDGSDVVGERRLRRGDGRDDHVVVGVEEVLHHHHRVVPLLERLVVEVRGELRQRLGVVVNGDRDVLLRGRELVRDLLVEFLLKGGHALESATGPARPGVGPERLASSHGRHPRQTSRAAAIRASPTGRGRSSELALDLADELKQERLRRKELRVLPGRTIGMIFHKPSTRTRVGFEVGIAELGGMALYLPAADLQLARGESYRDTALVLSRFVSALLIRTFDQAEVDTFAEHASIPVINGLTDLAHPLQALADAMTIRERLGGLEGVRLTYLGDGNNVCHSLMRLAARFGMHFTAACPAGYEPSAEVVAGATADAAASGGSVRVTTDPLEGADGADVLYTDVWTSMGQEEEREQRLLDLERFSLDGELLSVASREAVAMHCLPAHVGEEISEDVLYGPRSLVWDQAENRLHTQKAVMALVIR